MSNCLILGIIISQLKLKKGLDCVYIRWVFLLLKKYMPGSRIKLALLRSFFVFVFAVSFFALIQSYAQTSIFSQVPILSQTSSSVSSVYTGDSKSLIHYDIVPDFWLREQVVSFDFDSDASFQKFLHTDHAFTDTSYVPGDLVPIHSNFTANNSKIFMLREEAAIQFADMAWHFRNAFSGDRLYVTSAYRSRGFQDYLVKQWCSLIKCAKSGTSEHQAWLAVDLKVTTKWGKAYWLKIINANKYYDWLATHAASFGFHNTYQKGVEVDGKVVEWWHRRYLWIDLATLLSQNKQTLAEYYHWLQN